MRFYPVLIAAALAACAPSPNFAALLAAPAPPVPPASPVACQLPPVPETPEIVGYPDATTIYVTVDDLSALVRATAESAKWMKAVTKCVGSSAP
jgi:hypothetical protein